MQMISMTSFKGGVGKTTSAVHISGVLASQGNRVILVDRDRTRNSLGWNRNGNLGFPVCSDSQASRLLQTQQFDYMIVDSRGGIERAELEETVESSDFIVIPTIPDFSSLEAMLQTIESVKNMFSGRMNHKLAVMLTQTRGSGRPLRAKEVIESEGVPLLDSHIRASEAFKDAAEKGRLISSISSDQGRKGWEDYVTATNEIMHIMNQQNLAVSA